MIYPSESVFMKVLSKPQHVDERLQRGLRLTDRQPLRQETGRPATLNTVTARPAERRWAGRPWRCHSPTTFPRRSSCTASMRCWPLHIPGQLPSQACYISAGRLPALKAGTGNSADLLLCNSVTAPLRAEVQAGADEGVRRGFAQPQR